MKQKRHPPEEIVRLLRENDASGQSQEKNCQQKQTSVPSPHSWRKKYGLTDEADAKQLKALEKKNAKLKKMYAEAMLGNKILVEALEKREVSAAYRRESAIQVLTCKGMQPASVMPVIRIVARSLSLHSKSTAFRRQAG